MNTNPKHTVEQGYDQVVHEYAQSEPIYDIVVGEGGVWVTGDTLVKRLDPTTGEVTATLRADQFGDGTPFRLAVSDGLICLLQPR